MHYSMMGNREKEKGVHHRTHEAYFQSQREGSNAIAIVENVTEYCEELVRRELGDKWKVSSIKLDPRCFGFPSARARIFLVCWKHEEVQWTGSWSLRDFIMCLRSPVVMSAADYFHKNLPKTRLSRSKVP